MDSNPLIRKLEGYAPLSEEDKATIRALCEERVEDVPDRTDIIREGDAPDYIHLVLAGWAARYMILPDGTRQITAFLIPGDFCDLHVTILERMDHGIVTLTPCKVAHLDPRKLDDITSNRTMLTKGLWWMTLVDEAVLREWVVNSRRDALAAMAHLLCELHLRLKAVGLVHNNRLELPLTQEELSDATSMTDVHVNRTLKKMKKGGLIELKSRSLFIPDVRALAEAGGFDDGYLHLRKDTTRRGER